MVPAKADERTCLLLLVGALLAKGQTRYSTARLVLDTANPLVTRHHLQSNHNKQPETEKNTTSSYFYTNLPLGEPKRAVIFLQTDHSKMKIHTKYPVYKLRVTKLKIYANRINYQRKVSNESTIEQLECEK